MEIANIKDDSIDNCESQKENTNKICYDIVVIDTKDEVMSEKDHAVYPVINNFLFF